MNDILKKPRQRLTVTSMISAIEEMYRATLPSDQPLVRCDTLLYVAEKGVYVAELRDTDDEDTQVIESTKSDTGFEEALAEMMDLTKRRLIDHKKNLVTVVDSVLARHQGAIKGARSKMREKKTE